MIHVNVDFIFARLLIYLKAAASNNSSISKYNNFVKENMLVPSFVQDTFIYGLTIRFFFLQNTGLANTHYVTSRILSSLLLITPLNQAGTWTFAVSVLNYEHQVLI